MSNEYRVTIPDSRTEYDPQAHAETTHAIRTVLWQGDARPDDSIIDKLIEGQTERSQSDPRNAATYMNIEQRRRMHLGWFVVDRVSIPGA